MARIPGDEDFSYLSQYDEQQEARAQLDEQRMDDMLLEDALAKPRDVIDNLTYQSYRWQRSFYGLAAERLAKVYPLAHKYEERYQEEIRRAA